MSEENFACVLCVCRVKMCTVTKKGALEPQNRSVWFASLSPLQTTPEAVSEILMSVTSSACCHLHSDVCCESCIRHLNRGLKYIERHFPHAFILWFFSARCILPSFVNLWVLLPAVEICNTFMPSTKKNFFYVSYIVYYS